MAKGGLDQFGSPEFWIELRQRVVAFERSVPEWLKHPEAEHGRVAAADSGQHAPATDLESSAPVLQPPKPSTNND